MSEPLLDYTEKRRTPILLFCTASFFFTQFLFFVDEGYYDFRWMLSPGNWLVFFVYAFPMVAIMVGSWKMIENKILNIILGIVLGSTLVISGFNLSL